MTAVCIAGMHRSGTSLFARALNVCGLYLGEESDLAPAARDNPEGYWENIHFLSVNERILTSLRGAWDLPPSVEPGWVDYPEIAALRNEAQSCIQTLSAHQHWGWKDPRSSLTLPFWRQLIPNLKVIVCVREPYEVAQSLARRGAASQAFSMNLWRTYYERLLDSAPRPDRLVTHYDAVLHDGKAELQRILTFLGMPGDEQTVDNARLTVNATLRHHQAAFTDVLGSAAYPDVADLYSKLCAEAGPMLEVAIAARSRQAHIPEPDAAGDEAAPIPEAESSTLIEELRGRVWRNAYTIKALRHEITWQADSIESLEQGHRPLEQEIGRLRILEAELIELRASLAFEFLSRYRRFLERYLPDLSRRRQIYDRFIRIARLLVFEGPRRLYQTLRSRRAAARTPPVHDLAPAIEVGAARPPGATPRHSGDKYADAYSDLLSGAAADSTQDFVPLSTEHLDSTQLPLRAIAFYLPQYHPIPENDVGWGRGFTEWTNVSKALPQFLGHYQPRLPGELGFYDLRLPEVQRRQIELARTYGIHGFGIHFYWFNGKRLLDTPLDNFVNMPGNDFPFCLCWANENWTRRWDGRESSILIAQQHSAGSDSAFIRDIAPYLRRDNYIRIGGRPVLVVYRLTLLPDPRRTAERWRQYCRQAGLGDPYLVAAQTFEFVQDPREYGYDASVQFPPHNIQIPSINGALQVLNPRYRGHVHDYADFVNRMLQLPQPDYPLFRTVMPGWDNEARMPGRGITFAFSAPAKYQEWLEDAGRQAMTNPDPQARLIFINAWNEWGEAAYLEPDRRYGYAYLQATADALNTLANDPRGAVKPRQVSGNLIKTAPVVVYQMGKVGSMSVADSLKQTYDQLSLPVQVYHVHNLNYLDELERTVRTARANPSGTLEAIKRDRVLRAEIDRNKSQTWNVITLVREPVGRNIAWFFQNLPELMPDWLERCKNGSLGLDELREIFFDRKKVVHGSPEQWFDRQLRPVFGVDVFAEPFPKDVGYKIYAKSSRLPLLLIRMENLTACGPAAIGEFLGLDHFVLTNSNMSADKDYAAVYRAFKQMPLPRAYLEEMYHTRSARHFYTDGEIERFIAGWNVGPTG